MAVQKYVFFEKPEGLFTYEVTESDEYILKRYHGENCFCEKDMKKFFQWFNKMAAIANDDLVDFCFLMQNKELGIHMQYLMQGKSTWTKGSVANFLKAVCPEQNFCLKYKEYSILIENNTSVFAADSVPLYIECIPAFEYSPKQEKKKQLVNKVHSVNAEELAATEDAEEGSVLYQYAMEFLKNI